MEAQAVSFGSDSTSRENNTKSIPMRKQCHYFRKWKNSSQLCGILFKILFTLKETISFYTFCFIPALFFLFRRALHLLFRKNGPLLTNKFSVSRCPRNAPTTRNGDNSAKRVLSCRLLPNCSLTLYKDGFLIPYYLYFPCSLLSSLIYSFIKNSCNELYQLFKDLFGIKFVLCVICAGASVKAAKILKKRISVVVAVAGAVLFFGKCCLYASGTSDFISNSMD